jgi:hypothetical protein
LVFYHHKESWHDDCPKDVAFPIDWDGHAFVAYHGSYFRDVPVPGQIVRVPISSLGNVIGGGAATPMSILRNAGSLNGISPVDLNFDHCGRLLITSDGQMGDGRPGSQEGRHMSSEPMFTSGGVASSGLSKPVKIRLAPLWAWLCLRL